MRIPTLLFIFITACGTNTETISHTPSPRPSPTVHFLSAQGELGYSTYQLFKDGARADPDRIPALNTLMEQITPIYKDQTSFNDCTIESRNEALDALKISPSGIGFVTLTHIKNAMRYDRWLPKAIPLDPKPSSTPQDVYDAIGIAGGSVHKYGEEKNILISLINDAINGHPYARDAEIRLAILNYATRLNGLDGTIIGLLPEVVLPNKPTDMDQGLFDELILIPQLPDILGFQENFLNLIQEAIHENPDFGAARDAGIEAKFLELHPHVTLQPILHEATEGVKAAVNRHFPENITQARSGLTRAVYLLITGAGLTPFHKNQMIQAIALIIGHPSVTERMATIIEAVYNFASSAPIGFTMDLLVEVNLAQHPMTQPPTLPASVFDEITRQYFLPPAKKNAIIENVAAAVGLPDAERDQAILETVLANGGDQTFVDRIRGAFPITPSATPIISNFRGILLPEIPEGTGSGPRGGSDGRPTWFVVRVTHSNDPAIPVGTLLYLHPDRYAGHNPNYGDRVFFDRAAGGINHSSGTRLRLIMGVPVFR
jgi:hypothetical protein